MWVYRHGEISHTSAVSERPVHAIQGFQVNRGEPVSSASLCKMRYAKQPEREDGKSDTGGRTTPYYRRVRVMPQEGRELHVAIFLRETYPILRD